MNYDTFFGFSESPFLDVSDPKFLFLAKQHEAALSELTEFVTARQGIAVVSGDEGVGKTMLLQALIQRLPQSFHPLNLTRPAAEPLAITLMIAQSLGLDLGERTLVSLTPLADAIKTAAQQNHYLVLIMEDAHLLTDQNLEEIYMLSQLENQGQQLIPIILAGRKGLIPKVSSKANERLHDLIRTNISLNSLTFEETTLYIDHRLQQVGSSFQDRFAEGCNSQIFSRTGGVPRRINQVCDQALNRAWQENRSRVSRDLLVGEAQPAPYKPLTPPAKWRSLNILASVVAAVLLAGLAAVILYNNYETAPPANPPLPPASASAVPEKVPEKTPGAPLQQESVPALATVPQPQPPTQTAEQAAPKPELPPAAPQAPPEPAAPGPSPKAATIPPVPQAGEPAAKPESTKATTYQVAPQDGLLKIVSTYYPDNKDTGYDAVLLANPRITNEDFIYPGQTLTLPKIDKSNNVITIGGKEYYKIYGLYYSSAEVARATAKLKGLELHFVIRETEIPGEGKIYRVFLGSYGSPKELKKAMAELGNN